MDNLYLRLVVEAIISGLLLAALVYIALRLYRPRSHKEFYVTLIVAGFLGHILMELLGANEYYCSFGRACTLQNRM